MKKAIHIHSARTQYSVGWLQFGYRSSRIQINGLNVNWNEYKNKLKFLTFGRRNAVASTFHFGMAARHWGERVSAWNIRTRAQNITTTTITNYNLTKWLIVVESEGTDILMIHNICGIASQNPNSVVRLNRKIWIKVVVIQITLKLWIIALYI